MANTTDLLLCCFDEDEIVAKISEVTGINFLKISDGEKCGGTKVLSLEVYGACYRSLDEEKIMEVIEVFKSANFIFPELASLTINDDNQVFKGIIVREVTAELASAQTTIETLSTVCGTKINQLTAELDSLRDTVEIKENRPFRERYCSKCKNHPPLHANYCPSCGARIVWK